MTNSLMHCKIFTDSISPLILSLFGISCVEYVAFILVVCKVGKIGTSRVKVSKAALHFLKIESTLNQHN